MGDEMRDDQAKAAGAECASHAHENRHVVLEHFSPDAMRDREAAPLKRNPFHARQDFVGGQTGFDRERLDRRLKKPRFLFHAW